MAKGAKHDQHGSQPYPTWPQKNAKQCVQCTLSEAKSIADPLLEICSNMKYTRQSINKNHLIIKTKKAFGIKRSRKEFNKKIRNSIS